VRALDVPRSIPSLLLADGPESPQRHAGRYSVAAPTAADYRLKYKLIARSEAPDGGSGRGAGRGGEFKILINSFYGYSGFPARASATASGAEVTRQGRATAAKALDELRGRRHPRERRTPTAFTGRTDKLRQGDELLAPCNADLPVERAGIEDGYEAIVCY